MRNYFSQVYSKMPPGLGLLWVGGGSGREALLLSDLLRQHLPSKVSFEELLQAGSKDRQLLGVEVFLGGDTRSGF